MYKTQKRIPTLLGLLLIVLGISTLSVGQKTISSLTTLADPGQKPENIKITNVMDSSFSVSWITKKETPGVVLTKDGNRTLAFLDDLDKDGKSHNRILHHVTVKNLKADTSYTAQIQSGETFCNQFFSCPSLTQSTLEKFDKTSGQEPAYGSVLDKNGQPVGGALVYLTINNRISFSAQSDRLGKWVIPLIISGNENTDKILDTDQIQITAWDTSPSSGSVSLDGSILHKNREVPPIQIGTSQTLKLSQNTFGALSKNKTEPNVLGSSSDKINKIEIYFPKEENDTTTDPRPRIRGSALPGTPLTLTLNFPIQIEKVTPDNKGIWEWRPSLSLSPGTHTITVQGYDQKKKLISLSRTFIVLKSGEAVLGDSTPSASLTSTPTTVPITATPTPTVFVSPTPSPTVIVSPSSTPQPTPTLAKKPQATGNTLPSALLIASGALFFVLGAKFLLFP